MFISTKQYINLPFTPKEICILNDLPPENKILLYHIKKSILASISYAENILGYTICEQNITAKITKIKSNIILDTNVLSNINILTKNQTKYIVKDNLIIFDASVKDIIIKCKKKIDRSPDDFIKFLLLEHIKIICAYLESEYTLKDINLLYEKYRI